MCESPLPRRPWPLQVHILASPSKKQVPSDILGHRTGKPVDPELEDASLWLLECPGALVSMSFIVIILSSMYASQARRRDSCDSLKGLNLEFGKSKGELLWLGKAIVMGTDAVVS